MNKGILFKNKTLKTWQNLLLDAAWQPPCRWKAASWRAFRNTGKCFGCFEGFVKKRKNENQVATKI
jgi:hypothetical protein